MKTAKQQPVTEIGHRLARIIAARWKRELMSPISKKHRKKERVLLIDLQL
jgi:hypothetical protein